MAEKIKQIEKEHAGQKIKVWFEDEARLGQQGTLTRMWAQRGSRPTAIRQTEYKNLYVLSAVCPSTGEAEGMISPELNTDVMSLFLEKFSERLTSNEHAVMILDGAGYHCSKRLEKSSQITLIYLPPYSPELNPVERLWHYLRNHYWSNHYFSEYSDLEKAAVDGWRKTCGIAEKVKSICGVNYL